jgi:uncharacterized protein YpmB
MICEKCDAEIPENSEFCLKCGFKIVNKLSESELSGNEVNPVISESSKIQPKLEYHKRINKLLIIIPIIIFVIAGSIIGYVLYQKHIADVENQAYHTKLINTILDISTQTYANEGVCGIVSQKWHDAIFVNDEDFNTVISNAEQALTTSDLGKNIKKGNAKIQNEMIQLQNPYKGYEDTYQLVLDLYDEYNELYSQATSPTGSLTSYNSDVDTKSDSFNTTLNRIEVVMPEIKSKISK